MKNSKTYLQFNAFLVKAEYNKLNFINFLKADSQVKQYQLDEQYKLKSELFVKKSSEKKRME